MLTEMDLCAIAQKWVYKMVDDSLVAGDALKDVDALVAALRDARAERDAAMAALELCRANYIPLILSVEAKHTALRDERDAALAENEALRRVADAVTVAITNGDRESNDSFCIWPDDMEALTSALARVPPRDGKGDRDV